mmetsp:Transcript_18538/g.30240  ORF Transcript_18538/g.30240 Transcript_18538/m.30240 type:complete len:166 (-) Transcript_18538:856-1353(-)
MLRVPSDLTQENASGDPESNLNSISFGYNPGSPLNAQHDSSDKTGGTSRFFGDDNDEKLLQNLSENCSHLGVEVSVLLKSLKRSLEDACQVTRGNVEAYSKMSGDVEMVVAANVLDADALVERTLALSLQLQGIESVKAKVQALDVTLQSYENMATALLKRNSKR